jgi:predicted DNA binding CopG/RHH family protein
MATKREITAIISQDINQRAIEKKSDTTETQPSQTRKLTIRIEEADYTSLKLIAKRQGMPVSVFIRHFIKQTIRNSSL